VEWGDAQEKTYQTIKILLTSDPILRLPDPENTFVLRTDVSDYGIGAGAWGQIVSHLSRKEEVQ